MPAARDLHDEADHARRIVLAVDDDDVADLAEPVAGGVEDGAPRQACDEDPLRAHASQRSPQTVGGWRDEHDRREGSAGPSTTSGRRWRASPPTRPRRRPSRPSSPPRSPRATSRSSDRACARSSASPVGSATPPRPAPAPSTASSSACSSRAILVIGSPVGSDPGLRRRAVRRHRDRHAAEHRHVLVRPAPQGLRVGHAGRRRPLRGDDRRPTASSARGRCWAAQATVAERPRRRVDACARAGAALRSRMPEPSRPATASASPPAAPSPASRRARRRTSRERRARPGRRRRRVRAAEAVTAVPEADERISVDAAARSRSRSRRPTSAPTAPGRRSLIAHGAGAGYRHPFLLGFARGMRDQGVATLRFNFPYVEAGRRMPGPAAHAVATWAAVRWRSPASARATEPVWASGKSYGGRMASMAAAEGGDRPGRARLPRLPAASARRPVEGARGAPAGSAAAAAVRRGDERPVHRSARAARGGRRARARTRRSRGSRAAATRSR